MNHNCMNIIPQRLSIGDEVRVIAPSRSMAIISGQVRSIALERLENLGLKVTFSKNCEERGFLDSSSVESRLEDLHLAFADPNVKGILTTIGGFNSIHLLRQIDYDLIKRNPKILCGYSDITVLQNAIFAKTGLVTYSGPHFSTFGCLKGIEYVIENFQRTLFGNKDGILESSLTWSDDEWYLDQEKREFFQNPGYFAIQPGVASGTVIGGNIDSMTVLQGTEFMPSLKDKILFLEDNYPMTPEVLDRQLHSLALQKDFASVKGVVFGRFQVQSKITRDVLREMIVSKKEFQGIPIIGGADFGHTLPMFTFPIGGDVRISSGSSEIKIAILKG